MNAIVFLLKALRKVYSSYTFGLRRIKKIFKPNEDLQEKSIYTAYVELFDQEANDFCYKLLESGKPCVISKFGTIELSTLSAIKSINQKKYDYRDYIEFITRKKPTLWWEISINPLCKNAGFFPNDFSLMPKYYELNLEAMKEIDALGSYIYAEKYFIRELKKAKKINIEGYYAPFLYQNPWTKILKGKKVLVIHPFEESIRNQYKRKHLIWENDDILPDFDLKVIKAEQSINDEKTSFNTWFDALESMKVKMSDTDFDIALIGAGAYGMPLAAYAKHLGKQTVHLAGWTQILFGIKGKRWVDMPSVSKYMNEYWVFPMANEVPKNFKMIENGCYW